MINIKKEDIEEIKKILKEADNCIILTGAGMGVDSGLSVFRSSEGLWEKYPKAKEVNLSFKQLANPENYRKYHSVVEPFYLDRFKQYSLAEPHSGFYELFGYVQNLPSKYFIITSNVDGLFQKAGFEESNINEVHGSIHYWQCSDYKCSKNKSDIIKINNYPEEDFNRICPSCGSFLRPNICMFYDMDFISDKYDEQHRKLIQYLEKNQRKKTAIIEIGAGEDIRTIRSMSEEIAYNKKTKVIRINPDICNNSDTISIPLSAAEGISFIMNLVED